MTFSDYAKRIRALGREVNPDALAATRALVAPLAGKVPDTGVHIVRDVAYGNFLRQKLDIFTADANGKAMRPTLIYVHGGGFVAGNKHTEGSPFYSNIGKWAVRHGYNGVVLTYRLAPQHQWPSGIEDLHLAIQFLRREGARHGVGQGPLFLMGQSAGAAHVAGYLAHPEVYAGFQHELAGAILLSGLYDYTSIKTGPSEAAYLGGDKALYGERSSLSGLVASTVPLLVSVAEMDAPMFEQQGLQLLSAVQARHQKLPRFVHAIGQNHLSPALYLGLDGDLLAPQLDAFIREHSG
jgi:triacylglycerol lipase